MTYDKRFSPSFKTLLIGTLASLFISGTAFAQADEGDELEGLFNKDEQSTPDVKPRSEDASPTSNPGAGGAVANGKTAEIKEVSDLGRLSEFSDVAVIQKRYLPKTKRFEAYIAPAIVLNDAFFLNYGLGGRLGYNFSERFGAELLGTVLITSERSITTELRESRGVITRSLITPKSYIGLDFKWVPVYGKMALLNGSIVPFDLYFSVGPGLTGTNQGSSEPSVHFGTGQIFARTQGTAFRWDFSWNMFLAKTDLNSSQKSLFNTLSLSLGMSFFFPGATYR